MRRESITRAMMERPEGPDNVPYTGSKTKSKRQQDKTKSKAIKGILIRFLFVPCSLNSVWHTVI